jgi:spore coat polysaccharide biosynthesis protein SpsF
MTSERLPGKMLLDLAGKPILRHVIDRVHEAQAVDRVVVATAYPGAGSISGACATWGEECYVHPGPQEDVLDRFATAAEKLGAEIVVRVCGDNPLIAPELIDRLVRGLRDEPRYKRDYDYAGWLWGPNRPAILKPLGYFAEAMTARALTQANIETAYSSEKREHVTPPIYEDAGRYSLRWMKVPKEWREKQPAAIDTAEDLKRVEEMLEASRCIS